MKIPRYSVLIGGLVLALFGIFGLMGLSNSLNDLARTNPKLSFPVALGRLAPHLILLLCWPAAIALLITWQGKRKRP
jgi:hypothetical protein